MDDKLHDLILAKLDKLEAGQAKQREEHAATREALVRLEVKVDSLTAADSKVEKRTSALEKEQQKDAKRWALLAGGAVSGGTIGAWLKDLIERML